MFGAGVFLYLAVGRYDRERHQCDGLGISDGCLRQQLQQPDPDVYERIAFGNIYKFVLRGAIVQLQFAMGRVDRDRHQCDGLCGSFRALWQQLQQPDAHMHEHGAFRHVHQPILFGYGMPQL